MKQGHNNHKKYFTHTALLDMHIDTYTLAHMHKYTHTQAMKQNKHNTNNNSIETSA